MMTTRRVRIGLGLVFGTLLLAACGERVQTTTVGTERKLDTHSWDASNSVFLAPGWTPGDKASWEAQMRARAQNQNDYSAPR
jgi:hypothetical protein